MKDPNSEGLIIGSQLDRLTERCSQLSQSLSSCPADEGLLLVPKREDSKDVLDKLRLLVIELQALEISSISRSLSKLKT